MVLIKALGLVRDPRPSRRFAPGVGGWQTVDVFHLNLGHQASAAWGEGGVAAGEVSSTLRRDKPHPLRDVR